MKGQRQAHSSVARGDENARDDWRTPTSVLDRVRMIGPIGLDPCGNADNSTGARIVYSGPDGNGIDGLATSWNVLRLGEICFDNWPYSDGMGWAEKMVAEARRGVPIIGLGPARVDTAWWRVATTATSAITCWRGRMTFDLPPNVSVFRVTHYTGRITGVAEFLVQVPGVLKIKVSQKQDYVLVDIEKTSAPGIQAAYDELIFVPDPPKPAPFPSALLFYNIPIVDVQRAFGDKVDIYTLIQPPAPPSRLRSIIGRAPIDDPRREEERA